MHGWWLLTILLIIMFKSVCWGGRLSWGVNILKSDMWNAIRLHFLLLSYTQGNYLLRVWTKYLYCRKLFLTFANICTHNTLYSNTQNLTLQIRGSVSSYKNGELRKSKSFSVCEARFHIKKCLKVRQKLGTRKSLKICKFENLKI